MNQTFITSSAEETQAIAEEFAHTLKGGDVLCLSGDLGYGKTTFIQGLAKGLGIKRRIISPTFIIMRSYVVNIKNQRSKIPTSPSLRQGFGRQARLRGASKNTEQKLKMFYHVDLFRISNEKEIIDLGLLDLFYKPENIVAIEWSEKMGKLLPEKRINIHFEYIDESKRKIDFQPNPEVAREIHLRGVLARIPR